MELKLKFEGEQAGRKLQQNMDKAGQQVREAMRGAAQTAANEIMWRGADDIESAGNFGERWQDALHADVKETQRNITVEARMVGGPPVSYWRVFEYGAEIHAKNASGLMWLPFSFAGEDAKGLWPSVYPGSLFRVDRKSDGLAMLFDADDRQPKYFGKESVTIPQKFHLRQIIAQVSRELRSYYAEHMR